MATSLDWRTQVDFLALLDDDDRARLLRGATQIHLRAGEVIEYARDELETSILAEGLMRAFQVSDEGREATIGYLYGGEWIGALPAMAPLPVVFAQPLVESVVLRLDARLVLSLSAGAYSALDRAIAVHTATILARVVRVVTVRTLGTVKQRIAFDVLERASADRAGSGGLEISASHEELANSVGSAREVVTRVLADLKRRSIVTVSHRRLRIEQPVQLIQMVHGLIS